MFKRKDHFYERAKREGKASRAAYKIEEIQKKYQLIRKGDQILELGAAPGGWMQILHTLVGTEGRCVGIDRAPLKISIPSHVTFFQNDFEDPQLILRLQSALRKGSRFNVIVSDLSPDLTGIHFRDTYQSFAMALKVFEFCQALLAKGGHCVIKIFPGEEFNKFKLQMATHFEIVKTFIPEATRKSSSEVYLIAKGFKTD